MMRKTVWITLAAATLLAACAQKPATQASAPPPPPPANAMLCNFQWCPNYVQVVTTSGSPVARLQWDEMRMLRGFSDGMVTWTLVAPDYEFRANSVMATGANAAGASIQFPVRQLSPTQFTLDALNRSNLTYAYEVRVYRKGTPADATPLIARGTVVNAVN